MCNKLNFSDIIDGRIFLFIDSDRLSEYLEFLKNNDNYGIGISRYHGYKLENLDFLKECPYVKYLYIQDCVDDVSAIHYLKSLHWLLLPKVKNIIDFSFFPQLEILRGKWSLKHRNLSSCKNLHTLSYSNFNPKSYDLTHISDVKSINTLIIKQSTIETLKGIESLSNLYCIELYFINRLKDISMILRLNNCLRELRLDHCKKVMNIESISKLKSLNKLAITDCGEMQSVDFIKHLYNLEEFIFVNTNVADGDLSVILKHQKLKYVGFINKRHYSHKRKEIQKELNGNK